jgi:hypothetical protein
VDLKGSKCKTLFLFQKLFDRLMRTVTSNGWDGCGLSCGKKVSGLFLFTVLITS